MEAICEPFYGCYLAPQATFLDSLLLVTKMAFPKKTFFYLPMFTYLFFPTPWDSLPHLRFLQPVKVTAEHQHEPTSILSAVPTLPRQSTAKPMFGYRIANN